MGITTASGETPDYRYINNGLRPHNFSSLGIAAQHNRVQADFSPQFAKAVQLLRHKVGYDLPVSSGYRSIAYNKSVYQARGQKPTSNSRHTHGDAIDINMAGMSESKRASLLGAALDAGFTGVGFYASSDLMHIDARPQAARWGNAPTWAAPVLKSKWSPELKAYGRDYQKALGDVAPADDIALQGQSSYLTAGDRDIVIRTVMGEAAGEGNDGMEAVAHVIRNRTTDSRWPDTAAEVSKQPSQFSTWNAQNNGGNTVGRNAQPNDPIYQRAAQAVDRVFNGQAQDPTGGAVYYYAPQGMPGGVAPNWWEQAVAEGAPKSIGNHRFAGRSRADSLGQGTGPQNPGRGQAPQTMRVQEQSPVDAKNWTSDQHELYRKTGKLPTVTRWYEKVVPGSQIEKQHRESLQPTVPTPQRQQEREAKRQQLAQSPNREPQQPAGFALGIDSFLQGTSAQLASLVSSEQQNVQQALFDDLLGGGSRLSQITPYESGN